MFEKSLFMVAMLMIKSEIFRVQFQRKWQAKSKVYINKMLYGCYFALGLILTVTCMSIAWSRVLKYQKKYWHHQMGPEKT